MLPGSALLADLASDLHLPDQELDGVRETAEVHVGALTRTA